MYIFRNCISPFRNRATGGQRCETFFLWNNFYKERKALARRLATRLPLYLPFPRVASAVSTSGARALLISSKYETSKTVPSLSRPLSLPRLAEARKNPRENSRGYSNFDGSTSVHPTVSYSSIILSVSRSVRPS